MSALKPVKVKLSTPVKDFGNTIREVTIKREGNGGDLLAIDGLKVFASELVMIQRLCGISREAAESLSMTDITAISDAIDPFVGRGIRPGASPSDLSPCSDGDQ